MTAIIGGIILKNINNIEETDGKLMDQKHKIRFATWNIDTNFSRLEDGYAYQAFEQWRIKNRIDQITYFIRKVNPDILHLQELRKQNNNHEELINSLDPLQQFLKEEGYNVLTGHYKTSQFQYITAYKQNQFSLKEEYTAPMTSNNDTTHRHALIVTLEHKNTNQIIRTYNVHMDPVENTKNPLNDKRFENSCGILKLVGDYIKDNPKSKIIIAGDFNSFPDRDGEKQIEIFTNRQNAFQLLDLTNKLLLPNGKEIDKTTFFYFPYDWGGKTNEILISLKDPNGRYKPVLQRLGINDKFINTDKDKKSEEILKNLETAKVKELIKCIFSNECKAKGGHLDHILVYNLKADSSPTLEVSPQFEPYPVNYTEEEIKEYIVMNIDNGPAFASDHQLIWVDLTLIGDVL